VSASARVRTARAEDADTIADLLGQLGYPATSGEVAERIEKLEAHGHAVTYVAEHEGVIAGVATGHVFPSLHATKIVGWLTTLVVDDKHHKAGVGRLLTEAVEAWAREKGAERVSVTSGNQRHEAHAFYEHLGYERTGQRLTKKL
jgi:N-acetylglutamate synthase-like GNAT family acetyltransferase